MSTRIPHLLALILIIPLFGYADAPTLPRGLGFRIAGQPESLAQLQDNLVYIREALVDAPFDPPLQVKLEKLLTDASTAIAAAKTPADAHKIVDRLDQAALALMTAEQLERLARRTNIAFVELFILNNGFSRYDVDEKQVTAFSFSAEQATRIRNILDRLHPDRPVDPKPEGKEQTLTAIAARRALRATLTPVQRKMLDEKIEAMLKAAIAESVTAKPKAP